MARVPDRTHPSTPFGSSGSQTGYLHGYSPSEQKRLIEQAHFLEEKIFDGLDLTACRRLLEIGCGTGAECEILLRRYPDLFVTAIDISSDQLAKAREYLNRTPELARRCEFIQADARDLSTLRPRQFDSAYFCWVLEHVSAPVQILTQTRSVLAPNSPVFVSEVFNHTLFLEPPIPALDHYWSKYNLLQHELGGDPNVGVKLGGHLCDADFHSIQVWPKFFLFDSRDPAARAGMLDYWLDLMLSGSGQLIERGLISSENIEALQTEWTAARERPGTVFYYNFMQALAFA